MFLFNISGFGMLDILFSMVGLVLLDYWLRINSLFEELSIYYLESFYLFLNV